MRDERSSVVASLVGCHAPLHPQGGGIAELQSETSENDGSPNMGVQLIGNVHVEQLIP